MKIFALSGYEFRREWLQRKSTMGYAENITGNIRSKGECGIMFKTMVYGGIEYADFVIDTNGNIKNLKTNHIYKFNVNKAGYLMVYIPLGKRGAVKGIRVHKAVAETFIPNHDNKKIVHHKDENKKNPYVDNLEWVTPKENTKYHLIEESKKMNYIITENLRKKMFVL